MQQIIQIMWNRALVIVEAFVSKYARGGKLNWPGLQFEIQGDLLTVRLAGPVECCNWPYKNTSSANKKCHIFIRGKFECRKHDDFDGGQLELLSYVTEIAYYQPIRQADIKTVKSLDGYHFDMDDPLKRAHPVFHLQRRPMLLADTISEMGYTINDEDTINDTLHHVRVPTPQFDVLAALIMVLADQLVTSEDGCEMAFLKLIEGLHQVNKLRPPINNLANLDKCLDDAQILPGHWYASTLDADATP